MSNTQSNPEFYKTDGTLRADAPSYIERPADRELLENVLASHYCFVLTTRQMGKSSLMTRTARKLKKQDVATATVDLTKIGSEPKETNAEQWCFGIVNKIGRDLGIRINLQKWWKDNNLLTPINRLSEFYSEVVLEKITKPIVVFVDEIEYTLPLSFSDDFFAATRACYNARSSDPRFERLTFVLLGTASPTDLMKDPRRTPYNIGKDIDLRDFTFEEALPLAKGLGSEEKNCHKIFERVYYWTAGHPSLTQKICKTLAGQQFVACMDEDVDKVVADSFFKETARRNESNLQFVEQRLISSLYGKKHIRQTLNIYQKVHSGQQIVNDSLSQIQSNMKLSGIVIANSNQMLEIRNKIYKGVFNEHWIEENIPHSENSKKIILFSIIFVLLSSAIWFWIIQTDKYQIYKINSQLSLASVIETDTANLPIAIAWIKLLTNTDNKKAMEITRSYKTKDKLIYSKFLNSVLEQTLKSTEDDTYYTIFLEAQLASNSIIDDKTKIRQLNELTQILLKAQKDIEAVQCYNFLHLELKKNLKNINELLLNNTKKSVSDTVLRTTEISDLYIYELLKIATESVIINGAFSTSNENILDEIKIIENKIQDVSYRNNIMYNLSIKKLMNINGKKDKALSEFRKILNGFKHLSYYERLDILLNSCLQLQNSHYNSRICDFIVDELVLMIEKNSDNRLRIDSYLKMINFIYANILKEKKELIINNIIKDSEVLSNDPNNLDIFLDLIKTLVKTNYHTKAKALLDSVTNKVSLLPNSYNKTTCVGNIAIIKSKMNLNDDNLLFLKNNYFLADFKDLNLEILLDIIENLMPYQKGSLASKILDDLSRKIIETDIIKIEDKKLRMLSNIFVKGNKLKEANQIASNIVDNIQRIRALNKIARKSIFLKKETNISLAYLQDINSLMKTLQDRSLISKMNIVLTHLYTELQHYRTARLIGEKCDYIEDRHMSYFFVYKSIKMNELGKYISSIDINLSLKPLINHYGAYAYHDLVIEKSKKYGFDPYLMLAIIQTETHGNTMAISSANARGLTQLTLQTAKLYTPTITYFDLHNPEINIEIASRHMVWIENIIRKNFPNVNSENYISLIPAAWHAGMGNVLIDNGVPNTGSTRMYVRKVIENYSVFTKNDVDIYEEFDSIINPDESSRF